MDFSQVLLVDRNGAKLAETQKRLGAGADICVADLSDAGTAATAVAQLVLRAGRVDVLVNAAGNTARCGIEDTSAEAFDRMFHINVRAPLLLMQHAVPHMLRQGGGIIINIASMLAYGGPPNLATYSASKAALVALSRNAANTWKRQGVRCYAVNLGWALTEGEQALQTGFHKLPEDWGKHIGGRMPAGRLIVPNDIADLAAYLISPSAGMMNGAIIDFEQMPVGVFDNHPALAPE